MRAEEREIGGQATTGTSAGTGASEARSDKPTASIASTTRTQAYDRLICLHNSVTVPLVRSWPSDFN